MALDALLNFACESEFGGYRPGHIEVDDPALAEYLNGLLAEAAIEVRLVDRLDAVQRVLESMMAAQERTGSRVPGALDGKGVTVQRLQRYAEAAAAFHRAAPWHHLTDNDLVRIEEPQGPREMQFAVVLGNARNTYGMVFYRCADDYFQFRQRAGMGDLPSLPESGVWEVTFEPIIAVPLDDADVWEKHGLPVAGDGAYPVAAQLGIRGQARRPDAVHLAFLEAILRAFADTSESEIDSGRWHKRVETLDGPTDVVLSLPDLLEPPSHQTLMQRGLIPDRRAHERMFADMERYFLEHPPENVEEMNVIMQSQFVGKTIDQTSSPAKTSLEKAQDLCYQAFDTPGRRAVQLARQAAGICPDCADAYVILAEHSGTLEAELDYYAKGTAAGERALGPAAFEEQVGHFWGMTSTRPYMRARLGLATTLEQQGRMDEAVEHYQELLRLNPNDNQGVRDLLLPRLLELGRDVEAGRLLKSSEEESAIWTYARALLAFRLSGKSAAASRELRRAFRANRYAPEALAASELPPTPNLYSPGSPEEGEICALELCRAFVATPGAIDWLVAEFRRRERVANARQKQRRGKERQKRKKRKGR